MSDHKLKVGQQLWYVPDAHRRVNPMWITVEKVGRKWATIADETRWRIALDNLVVDLPGFGAIGSCWLAKEEHDAYVGLRNAWGGFRHNISNRWAPPSGITIAQITEAQRALGIAPTQETSDAE